MCFECDLRIQAFLWITWVSKAVIIRCWKCRPRFRPLWGRPPRIVRGQNVLSNWLMYIKRKFVYLAFYKVQSSWENENYIRSQRGTFQFKSCLYAFVFDRENRHLIEESYMFHRLCHVISWTFHGISIHHILKCGWLDDG